MQNKLLCLFLPSGTVAELFWVEEFCDSASGQMRVAPPHAELRSQLDRADKEAHLTRQNGATADKANETHSKIKYGLKEREL